MSRKNRLFFNESPGSQRFRRIPILDGYVHLLRKKESPEYQMKTIIYSIVSK